MKVAGEGGGEWGGGEGAFYLYEPRLAEGTDWCGGGGGGGGGDGSLW